MSDMVTSKTVKVSIRLDRQTKKALDRLSLSQQRTVSDYLRRLIERAIKATA